MINYANSKIYKITCNITGLTYYGSTVNSLSRRMVQHRSNFKCDTGTCKYKLVLASGDYDCCLVESYPCADKTELHRRERFYIESFECVNSYIPGRSQKEYRDVPVHKEKIKEYKKEYNAKNKETISKQMKVYYSDNKERFSEKTKEYRAKNKETISKRNKKYYMENKEKNEAKAAVIITCECGCIVRKDFIYKHRKTQKHINLM